jgi:Sec-independent protein translocase protein TatA
MPERQHSLVKQLRRLAWERWARRALRTVLQSTSIALGVWCAGMGANLLWSWNIGVPELTALALAIVGVALLSLLRPPMRPAEVARRLDRRFNLNEQLATAVEMVQIDPRSSPMTARLLDRSTATAYQVHRYVRQRQAAPWTDLLTLLALLLVAGGLALISGIGSLSLNPSSVTSLPALPQQTVPLPFPMEDMMPMPGSDQFIPLEGGEEMLPFRPGNSAGNQQSAAAPSQQSAPSTADPQTLEALANALRDLGTTRPVADALDRGDTDAAAQRLRELADQAGALSEEARQALSRALEEAARNIERRDPALAEQVRQSARDLARQQSAAQSLEELAQAIDQMDESAAASSTSPSNEPGNEGQASTPGGPSGQPGTEGESLTGLSGSAAGNNPSGEQRPVAPAGRLGVEGQPAPIEVQGGGQSTNTTNNPNPTLQGSAGTAFGGQPGTGGAIGADSLRILLDERDVVQEYFQP